MATNTKEVPAPEREVGLNVPLPETLHRRLKVATATKGMTIKDGVLEAIATWLDKQ